MNTKTKLALAAISTIAAITTSAVVANETKPSVDKKLVVDPPADNKKNKIQIALLLDTSNSMDGLIDQAK